MLIAGFHSGHECSYCILEDGIPIIHAELERYIREKEPFGDGLKLLFEDFPEYEKIKYFSHSLCTWKGGIQRRHPETYKEMFKIINKNDGNFFAPGHHEAHASSTFFSSNLEESLIVTIDGGGRDYFNNDLMTATIGIWEGKKNKIKNLSLIPDGINIGAFWASVTKKVFGLSVGHPIGNQAGTVMAMAAFGDSSRFVEKFLEARMSPWTFNFDHYKKLIDDDDTGQIQFDIAASFQLATEIFIKNLITNVLARYPNKNLCLSGGVSLNSVLVGKILDWFNFDNVYCDPVPYDGGLSIGSAQYIWNSVLDKPRIITNNNYSPFLGKTYELKDIEHELSVFSDKISYKKVKDSDVIDLIDQQNIVSVFGGASESGRRALGNRSILADPRKEEMKDKINKKVKHRHWFRPFAPSILREEVTNWFVRDVNSPYMSFVVQFIEEAKKKVPAVVHFDGSARLQTVTENDNKWYYNFIKQWKEKTGIPILLNTSFNDREPIVETPKDGIECFLGTDIDYLYFFNVGYLVNKK